ncbi:hypothetical protein GCM10018787_50990 [Streptomyces thermodiastaticus]|nr:hypothetical protein GCM10018787_50990 [Streptomyces thermodiastaticus]
MHPPHRYPGTCPELSAAPVALPRCCAVWGTGWGHPHVRIALVNVHRIGKWSVPFKVLAVPDACRNAAVDRVRPPCPVTGHVRLRISASLK